MGQCILFLDISSENTKHTRENKTANKTIRRIGSEEVVGSSTASGVDVVLINIVWETQIYLDLSRTFSTLPGRNSNVVYICI